MIQRIFSISPHLSSKGWSLTFNIGILKSLVPRIRSSNFSNLWTPTFELFLCPHGEGEVLHLNLFWDVLDLPQVYLVDQKNWEGENFVYNFQTFRYTDDITDDKMDLGQV